MPEALLTHPLQSFFGQYQSPHILSLFSQVLVTAASVLVLFQGLPKPQFVHPKLLQLDLAHQLGLKAPRVITLPWFIMSKKTVRLAFPRCRAPPCPC